MHTYFFDTLSLSHFYFISPSCTQVLLSCLHTVNINTVSMEIKQLHQKQILTISTFILMETERSNLKHLHIWSLTIKCFIQYVHIQ